MIELKPRKFHIYFPLLFLSGILLFGIIGAFDILRGDDFFGKVFIIIFLGILVYNGLVFSKIIVSVKVNESQIIIRDVLQREHEISIYDLNEIKINNGMTEIKTNRGKFLSFGTFDGFSEFVVLMKKVNPQLITKGC